MNKNYIKWYLREFYTEPLIDKDVWLVCKNFSLDDNLLIYCKSDSTKYYVSSLLLQYANSGKRINWDFLPLWRILSLQFDSMNDSEEDEDKISFQKLSLPDVLFIIENDDPKHSYYKNLLSVIINDRQLKNKRTVIIFTKNDGSDFMDKILLEKFTEIKSKKTNKSNKVPLVVSTMINSEDVF
jgi:hypothetical protein